MFIKALLFGKLLDKNRLDIHEFMYPEHAQLPPIAGLFDATKGQARIGFYKGVHKARAGLEPGGGDHFAAFDIPGKHRSA